MNTPIFKEWKKGKSYEDLFLSPSIFDLVFVTDFELNHYKPTLYRGIKERRPESFIKKLINSIMGIFNNKRIKVLESEVMSLIRRVERIEERRERFNKNYGACDDCGVLVKQRYMHIVVDGNDQVEGQYCSHHKKPYDKVVYDSPMIGGEGYSYIKNNVEVTKTGKVIKSKKK